MSANEFFPGAFKQIVETNNHFHLHTTTEALLEVTLITDTIIRIRWSTSGHFEDDFSYAVSKQHEHKPTKSVLTEYTDHLTISTTRLMLHIQKADMTTTFTDAEGHIICRDEKGFHWEEHPQYGGDIVKMSKVIQEGEHFYGLGDKTTHLNLRGKRLTNWAMDTYGFKKYEDPIYKAIPFYTAIHNDKGYGIFFDNTFKSHFDFGSERKTVTSFWADGGEMNYYFIYGPEMQDVIIQYSKLTGLPELPPIWILGYQQCKWSYYPEEKIREITQKMRQLSIPCDVIYFDIDYMDGFRCFTWDKEKFPDPKNLISDLLADGFKSVVIIDPGIKKDEKYPIFKEALENDYFCRRADGPYMKGQVWPGNCYFPDFTNPKVRRWWSGLFQELIQETGVRGVWNDMNEPALFEIEGKSFPDDVRHDFDGHPCSHRKAHNVYGMQMARATYKGLKRFLKNQRPVVITRSAYAGTQRYSAAWTGDNIASWEHLWLANVQIQRMATSGFSFTGSDIGGFIDHPTPELFVRWMQLAVFHPFCRTHSSGDHGDQEPWSFGEEALDIVRKYIEWRYQLLPYLYTAFYKYTQLGIPIVKPISVFDQHDKDTLYRADEFILGDHLLICPVLEPNVKSRYVYLPKGKWYDIYTGKCTDGGREISAEAPLDIIPVFIKAGAVIPKYPVMQHTGAAPVDTLTLMAYFAEAATECILYEDAGDGYDYEKGIYNVCTYTTRGEAESFSLEADIKGHFNPTYNTLKIEITGLPFEPKNVVLNGIKTHDFIISQNNGASVLTLETVRETFYKLYIQ